MPLQKYVRQVKPLSEHPRYSHVDKVEMLLESKKSDKYEKDVKASKKAKSTQTKKAVGAAVGGGAAAVGAHGAAKKKFPKYKKVMESSVTIKDGKLGLKSKKD